MNNKSWENAINIFRSRPRSRIPLIIAICILALVVPTIIAIMIRSNPVLAADILLGFNEGYGASVNDNNGSVAAGTITGAVWKTNDLCFDGKCLFFDGTQDYVSFTDDADLDFAATNSFTITAWIRHAPKTSGTDIIVGKILNSDNDGGYQIQMESDGDITCEIEDSDADTTIDDSVTSTAATYDDNQWHFIACVKNANTSLTLYIDGNQVAQDASLDATGSLANDDTFYIGMDGDGTSNDYTGFIDEVTVLRSAKTATELKADYLGSTTTFTGDGPVGYWKMDESSWTNDCSTDTVFDSSGNGNHGDACPTSTGPTGGAAGKFGNAGDFDGSNDYVQVPHVSALQPSTVTVSSWVKLTSTSGFRNIVDKTKVSDTDGYGLYMSSGVFGFRVATSTIYAAETGAITTGQWYHVSGTFDGSSVRIYLNGVLQNTTTSASMNTSNTDPLYIGAQSNCCYFPGTMDDLRIYGYARSQTQIYEDMNANLPSGLSASFGPDQSYLSNGLVGYWKMDETSGNMADSSGNGTTLTDTNTVAFVGGKFGNGGDFELGNTEYQSAADNSALSITGNLTVSAWIKPETVTAGTYNVISKWDGANESYRLMQNADEIRIELDASDNYVETTASNLATATWYHVVGVYDSSNASAKIFINGAEATSTTTGTIPSSIGDDAGKFHIGAEDSTGGATGYYDGIIDEGRIYNRALSPAEVQKLYNFAPGPVGHWKFDENTGSAPADTSGNGNIGSFNDTPTWNTGKYGSSMLFNGQNGVDVSDSSSLLFQNGDITVETWVNFNAQPALNDGFHIAMKQEEGGAFVSEFFLRYTDYTQDSSPNFDFRAPNAGSSIEGTTTVQLNQWYHVAGTFSDSNNRQRLYVNGVLEGENTQTNSIGNTAARLTLGRRFNFNDDGVEGKMDDVKIYNYERTATQIIEDMNAGHPAPGSPVGSSVAYWKFDEGYGTTANDNSVNANSLTLSTASWTNSGKFGKAFNGLTNVRLSRSDDPDLDFAGADDLTVSVWFKSDSATNPSANEYLVEKRNGVATDGEGYALYTSSASDGRICFGIDDDTTSFPEDSVCSTSDLYDNTWHHVAVTKTGTSRLDMYIDGRANGTPDTSISATGTLANAATFYIGDTDTTDGTNEFLGDIDEVKIFRSALTSDAIKVLYNQSAGQSLGALSTNWDGSSNVPSNADTNSYCPPGQGSTCTPPIRHWKLDENTGTTTTYDSSTNGDDGTITNATWAPGKLGSSLKFDGSGDYVYIGATAVVGQSTTYSISAWFKSQGGDTGTVYSEQSDLYVTLMFGLIGGGFFESGIWTGSSWQRATSTNAYNDDLWHHAVVTFSTSAGQKLYVDGVLVDTDSGTTRQPSPNNDPYIAAHEFAGAVEAFFTSQIDDVRIYDYVRTPAQVAWDYNRGGPVGWWKMDEASWTNNCSTDTVFDSSGNAIHGDSCPNTTGPVGGATGKLNNTGNFDGSDDYIVFPSSTKLQIATNLTVATWVYRNAADVTHDIFDHAASGETEAANHLYEFLLNSNNTIGLEWEYGAGTNENIASSVALSNTSGAWVHIAAVRDVVANTVTFYENGKQLGSAVSFTNDPTGGSSGLLGIGRDQASASGYFNGLIDDVRIYNYTLTPQQIKTVMGEGAVRFGPVTGSP